MVAHLNYTDTGLVLTVAVSDLRSGTVKRTLTAVNIHIYVTTSIIDFEKFSRKIVKICH